MLTRSMTFADADFKKHFSIHELFTRAKSAQRTTSSAIKTIADDSSAFYACPKPLLPIL